jgi:hypothetical protein
MTKERHQKILEEVLAMSEWRADPYDYGACTDEVQRKLDWARDEVETLLRKRFGLDAHPPEVPATRVTVSPLRFTSGDYAVRVSGELHSVRVPDENLDWIGPDVPDFATARSAAEHVTKILQHFGIPAKTGKTEAV